MDYDREKELSRRATRPGQPKLGPGGGGPTITPEEVAAAVAHNAKLAEDREKAVIERIRSNPQWMGDKEAEPTLPGHGVCEKRRKQLAAAQKRQRQKAKRVADAPGLFAEVA